MYYVSHSNGANTLMKSRASTNELKVTKAELLQEGIFFLLQIFARDVLTSESKKQRQSTVV